MMIRWSTADIADAVEAGLRARARQDDLEQAVYGFDVLDELRLHPLVQQALQDAGYGAWLEQRYPNDRERSRRSEGKRCDLVLTPAADSGQVASAQLPGAGAGAKGWRGTLAAEATAPGWAPLPLRDPAVKGTLFDGQPAVDPEDAYWLEVKTVAQHERDGPFPRYSAELLAPVALDVKKLWTDGLIRHAGLLIVLFTESQGVAEHDLEVWHRRCIERGYPVAPPALRGFAINNRTGNAWCAAAVFGVRGV